MAVSYLFHGSTLFRALWSQLVAFTWKLGLVVTTTFGSHIKQETAIYIYIYDTGARTPNSDLVQALSFLWGALLLQAVVFASFAFA